MSEDKIIQLFGRREEPGVTESPAEDVYPVVYTDEQPRIVLRHALRVMKEANDPPVIFRRAGHLVRLIDVREGDVPHIVPCTKRSLFRYFAEVADWKKRTINGEAPSSPPSRILDAILEDPDKGLLELDTVISVPVFGKDFDLIDSPGYHVDEQVYFHDTAGLRTSIPVRLDIAEARRLLLEAICDFPFTDQASRAHAVALMLLPFIRRAIKDAPTPLHIIESPTPGSGKGRLADLVAVINTGEPCNPTTLSASSAENRKKFTSLMVVGVSIILLDNIPQNCTLNDPALASVLTSTQPTDRLLGSNQMLSLNNQAVWIATANNPRFTLEIARRSVRIRIDPRMDRPWLRKNFRHEDLLTWAQHHRPELVQACLTLVLAWRAEGCPRWRGNPLGSFEDWSAVLGGILHVSGIPGFLGNLETMYVDADVETPEWCALTQLWWERFGGESVKASDLHVLCQQHEVLSDVIGYGGLRSQVSKLGRALNRNIDRFFGDFKIARDTVVTRSSARYVLRQVEQAADLIEGTESVDAG